ncbi:MAG: transcriptional regulator [Bacteroidota bacterium]
MGKLFDHQNIDALLHSRIRLSIIAVLVTVDEIDFSTLCKEVNTTRGNLSVHLKKLEEGKYIKIDKNFVDKKPLTTCKVTKRGMKAFQEYLDMVEQFSRQK